MSDIVEKIRSFNAGLDEHLVQMKYSFMSENLFRFCRGTNHLFYEDWSKEASRVPAPQCWICGDLHVENFGSYKGENRLVYFDINDFDESALAPASWEVVRTVCSIFAAFDALDVDYQKALRMAGQFLKSYSAALNEGKAKYIERATAKGIIADFLDSAAKRKSRQLLAKRTKVHKGTNRFRYSHERHEKLPKELRARLLSRVNAWIRSSDEGPYNYEAKDVVFRIAGTGSVGLKRYVFLLQSKKRADKFFLLDMKQFRPSSLLRWLPGQPVLGNGAETVIAIQKRMQNMPPALLSSISFDDQLYLLQEMQAEEDNINFKLLKGDYRHMYESVDSMGMLVASAQLRSAGRNGSATADKLIAFGADDNWHKSIIEYGEYYRHHVRDDYNFFLQYHRDIQPHSKSWYKV